MSLHPNVSLHFYFRMDMTQQTTNKCEAKMAKLAALPLAFIITSNVFVTPFTTIHPPRSGIKNHSFVPFTTTSYIHHTRSRGTRSFQDASQSSLGGKWDDLLDDEYETTNVS